MYYYKKKLGKEKKYRSIKEIHDLYIRTKKRSESRQNVINDIIDEIIKKVPLTKHYGSEKHITYFYNDDDTLYQYEMSYMSEWQSYGISINRVVFEGTVEEIRKQTIDFVISEDITFELGEKYHKNVNFNKNLHRRIMRVLIEAIRNNLVEIYHDVKFLDIPRVIPVSIGDCQYIFHIDNDSNRYYKDFKFIGELGIDPIIM